MNNTPIPHADFDAFIEKRTKASDAFVNGEYTPLGEVSTQVSPATIFGPPGTCVQGAEQVNAVNSQSADHFKPGSENAFETMHSGSSCDLAYWVGIQRSVAHMRGQEKSVPMNLRVTELFRREDGAWKLFHRHADILKEGK